MLGLVGLGLRRERARRRWHSRCRRGHTYTLLYLLCYTYFVIPFPVLHTVLYSPWRSAMQALLRAIKDEQGKSRGTRDALQRSMLC